jgi:hypothetical protein
MHRFCNSLSTQLRPRLTSFRIDFQSDIRDLYSSYDEKDNVNFDACFTALEEEEEHSLPSTVSGQCSFCMTRFVVMSSENGVSVATWQNLGDREPMGPVFRAIANSDRVEDCRVLSYPAGCVRKSYEEDADMLVEAEGKP